MWQDYIISNKRDTFRQAIIKGTRISVELILELLSAGWTRAQILESYPNLTTETLKAVFSYLKDCIQHEFYFPLSATA